MVRPDVYGILFDPATTVKKVSCYRFPLSVGFKALLFGLIVVVYFRRAGLLSLRQLVGWEVCP